jgi:hypothetical protein
MAIVTSEWKYIHWYYGEGMQPTEELFNLGEEPYEMINVATDSHYVAVLKTMRQRYDGALAAVAKQVVPNHSYEDYPTLFSRTVPWANKVALVQAKVVKGETPKKPRLNK